MVYVGVSLLGFSEKEVGRMTLRKWRNLYQHYKDHYDFTLKKVSYAQADEIIARGDEWFDEDEV
jgi:hypothetical protein|nr:MAG TPA: hypothetical protein [Caudoviricetes sp.]